MITRRKFIGDSAFSVAAISLLRNGFAQMPSRPADQPIRLAIIGSKFEFGSDLQMLTDRFLVGYPFDGEWHQPPVKVVSMYIDQPVRRASEGPSEFLLTMTGQSHPIAQAGHKQDQSQQSETARPDLSQAKLSPRGDLSAGRAEEFGFRIYKSIPDTLRCGGGKVAVDAVLCVVEQDSYPTNDRGQILLPQYDFFQQCSEVFRTDKRPLPYFNHRSLGFSSYEANRMLSTAKQQGIPLMAGSSMPYAFRLPEIALPQDAVIKEAVMVGFGDLNGLAYDALEAMKTLLESRKGGESTVRSVQLLEGDAVWEAQDQGRWPKDLLSSALSRSDTPMGLSLLDGRPQDLSANGVLPQLVKDPIAVCLEYHDGLRTTLLLLNGAIHDYNLAMRVAGPGIMSNQFLMTPPPNATHNAHLAAAVEQFIVSGSSSQTLTRNLLCTAVIQACFESRHQNNRLIEIPS